MAEAAVEHPTTRFFCHKCNVEISPVLPDFTCPRCQLGFIEEMRQGSSDAASEFAEEDLDTHAHFTEIWRRTLLESFRIYNDSPYSDDLQRNDNTEENERTEADASTSSGVSQSQTRDNRTNSRGSNLFPRRISLRGRTRYNVPLEGVIQQLLSGLSGSVLQGPAGLPLFLNLHGNPGDYAWGRGGLDAIITQLLNQLDGTGPPPLPKEKIDDIPTVNIEKEQVDKNLQCTVCMEDFKVDEPVRRLRCTHHFHSPCIVPWLELHATCPICRKSLIDEDMSAENSPTTQADSNSNSSNGSRQGSDSGLSSFIGNSTASIYDFLDEDYD